MTLRISAISLPSMNLHVPEQQSDRQEYIRTLFDGIAGHYDFLNHLLSSGLDIWWRKRAIRLLEGFRPQTVLDIATGTADFAIEAARTLQANIEGVDISAHMLAIGRTKVARKGLSHLVSLSSGAAEALSFQEGSFDAVIVAFGVRNFADVQKGLREMHRVLKNNGHALILEFSTPKTFPFNHLYSFYFRHILPIIGGLVSRSRDSYEYLPKSVREFPDDTAFLELMRSAGFTDNRQVRFTFGIATAYLGLKAIH